jgi:hypothetical protein
MTQVGALQEQQLMTQGKDFRLQRCPSSEAGWHGEKHGDQKGKHNSASLHIAAVQTQPFQLKRSF